MKQQTTLQLLLKHEVSRKEFLTIVGLGLVTFVGLGKILTFLGKGTSGSQKTLLTDKGGYGGR